MWSQRKAVRHEGGEPPDPPRYGVGDHPATRVGGGAGTMLTGPGATIGTARKLRSEMTLPEVLLWRELRQRPGGFKFRRQHPAGPYVLDFACVQSRLAIEIDGEAHGRGDRPAHDATKDEWLANQGYRTVRIPAREVLANLENVVRFVTARCETEQPLHHPAAPDGPPLRTGEDL